MTLIKTRAKKAAIITLEHEGGHQALHKPYAEDLMEPTLFDEPEEENESIILGRMEDQKGPIEIPADKFSYIFVK